MTLFESGNASNVIGHFATASTASSEANVHATADA